jgi:hypothetical protein
MTAQRACVAGMLALHKCGLIAASKTTSCTCMHSIPANAQHKLLCKQPMHVCSMNSFEAQRAQWIQNIQMHTALPVALSRVHCGTAALQQLDSD